MEIPDQFRLAVVLGAVVHTERNARGLSQQQLAAMAHLHPMALSKIERGIQQDIGVDTLQRLGGALSRVGAPMAASQLVAAAEHWQYQLYTAWQQGALPQQSQPNSAVNAGAVVAAGALSGAALAAVILLLTNKPKK
jgi:transcriptional regulator with XRE-family HTH domain